ncbi:MAG TPA: restriction endonuclease subunit M [Candidatus Saccharimonadia bacterium]|nr:restriction endonuclease subunit M [Candidatus Saccharimonadia bacterium]
MAPLTEIDISENRLRQKGDILDILLSDRTTKKNIIWGTDSYFKRGDVFAPKKPIKPEIVTGIYGKLIQPRAAKSLEEQRFRTREKAEVFTPLKIIDTMNKSVDWKSPNFPASNKNWQDYIKELRLEITCGEAPFIVSRYNPTAHTGKVIAINNRVGFLDRKLRAVSEYNDKPKDWLYWAKEAYKASYGYEWQGDNILIARENLLYTLIDYYYAKFSRNPPLHTQREFAEIISWNIFQMDGIKYVIPMSCKHESRKIAGELTLFGETPDKVLKFECSGCKSNLPTKHNGVYAKTMDWSLNKPVEFVTLVDNNLQLLEL